MKENGTQDAAVKLLALGSGPEFIRSLSELRAWGYAVTAVRNAADLAGADLPAFDLACVEIGPGTDAPLPLAALKRAFPGLAALGVTALQEEELHRFLSARKASCRDFTAILQPPLAFHRLLFAVEEALARRDEERRVLTGPERQKTVALLRRSVEAARLSDFLAQNSDRSFFLNFQPTKVLKEKKI